MKMIRLAKPYIPKDAIDKVIEVLKSGDLIQGKYVSEFEDKLQEYLNVKHVIAVSSGTAALHLSLTALEIKQGDEVIVPAFTYPATANVVELVGAKPILVDISLDDFCIDTTKIEHAITEKTKAIIPVHEFGQAAKMDDIIAISKKFGLKIIEDAACGLGAEFCGKKVGTFGEYGCFSFHPRKSITTGEGGAIATHDDILAKKVRSLRNHGIEIVNNEVDFCYAGFNYRMTDFQAAMGVPQLSIFDETIKKRIRIANEYNESLNKIKWIKTPKQFNNRKAVYQTYHVLINQNFSRDNLINHLNHHGIQTNYGAQALHVQKYFKKKYNYAVENFSNSLNAYSCGLALPIGEHISHSEIEEIVQKIKLFK
jgi:dTDP-4-amino-4,6-dideoxygalactose transaminase